MYISIIRVLICICTLPLSELSEKWICLCPVVNYPADEFKVGFKKIMCRQTANEYIKSFSSHPIEHDQFLDLLIFHIGPP